MGGFVIDCYIMSATWRRLTGSLKAGFYMIAMIATLALIAAIAEEKKFSYRSDHSDHREPHFSEFAATTISEIEPLFHVV